MKTKAWSSVALLAAGVAGAPLSCSPTHPMQSARPDGGAPDSAFLPRDAMLDPGRCKQCHQQHYDDWARSVHAYASDDPIFVAMNKRGQRETDGGLGDFCVKCHAPMAVMDGKTSDGLNLADLDASYHGVTCFFCHAVDSVTGTHNAALALSGDLKMRGEYPDPAPNAAHDSTYSSFFNRGGKETSQMCGACHDIVVRNTNAFIERTFCEWSGSAFADPNKGSSCIDCHMYPTNHVMLAPNAPYRQYHDHDWPAVDVPLNATDGVEQAKVQQELASTFYGALCVTEAGGIRAILDPARMGHAWPSGASQDRRAWVEVIAYSGGTAFYQSGVVPAGTSVIDLMNSNTDKDLWLLRDQMFDAQNKPVSMFWQAASTLGNEIPALSTFDAQDPSMAFYKTHVMQLYPRNGPRSAGTLKQMPDRVTMRLRLQPVGLDVLNDLVQSGDLAPSVPANMPTYDVSFLSPDAGIQPTLEWTPAAPLSFVDGLDRTNARCVWTQGFNAAAQTVLAPEIGPPTECTDAGADVFIPEDAGAAPDADAGPVCHPQVSPDNIAAGLTKQGQTFTFVLVSANPSPAEPKWDDWVVKILDKNGQPVTGATLMLPLPFMPLHQHTGSITSSWMSNGDGTYSIHQYLFMQGDWWVTMNVQSGATSDSVRFAFCAGG